jgi:GR25 family glycosyltransferase involved in LPS biosynthesis
MHMDITRNLGIILLSIDRNYRSSKLLNVVRSSGIEFLELDASTPERMHNFVSTSGFGQLLKIGRHLSNLEIATYETHLRAQVSSFSKSSLWTIIFEDDAIIDEETIDFLKSLAQFETDKPMFVNLYPNGGMERAGEMNDKDSSLAIIKTKILYSGAVAYALNNPAHRVIHRNVKFRTITPTDFPPLFNTFEKYHSRSVLVKHSTDVRSTIYGLGTTHKNRRLVRALGLISLLSFTLFHREYVTFRNFLDLEIYQRYLLRKKLRSRVS